MNNMTMGDMATNHTPMDHNSMNDTMDHMDHMNHTDHHATGHSNDHTSALHALYFHFSAQAVILFREWDTMTGAGKYTRCYMV